MSSFLQSVILIKISQGLSLDILKTLLRVWGKMVAERDISFSRRMILLWSAVWCGSYFLWVLLAGWMYWGPWSLHALLESAVLLTFPTAARSAFFASAVLRPAHTAGERHETNYEAISLLLDWPNRKHLLMGLDTFGQLGFWVTKQSTIILPILIGRKAWIHFRN